MRDIVHALKRCRDAGLAPPLAAASCAAFLALLSSPAGAQSVDVDQDGDNDNADLAQQLNNPVANLIAVPFQFNYDTGFGPRDADAFTLNIQPVVPLRINDDWNLISRTILPVRYRDSPAPGIDSASGLGDTVQSLFLSPEKPVGGWIVGGGPVFLLPTATEDAFKSKQLGIGPTAVGLRVQGGWTYGMLANHIWGVTDPDNREDVNASFLQPFVAHTFESATTLSINSESTYDWKANEWTIPINASVSQLVTLGKQPIVFQFTGRGYADSPDGGPSWGLRSTITFLFPK